MNPNSFLLGVPGSRKSFSAKMLIVFLALATGDDILICDPEREYASLIEAMGGEKPCTGTGIIYGWQP